MVNHLSCISQQLPQLFDLIFIFLCASMTTTVNAPTNNARGIPSKIE